MSHIRDGFERESDGSSMEQAKKQVTCSFVLLSD
jgi:hypothetical protein